MYSTNTRPKSKVRGNLPLINPRPKAEGFISGKLPMAKDEDRMFVEYTVIAIVHNYYIYYGDVILV